MKTIVVLSGKGGTGKTSVAASMAALASRAGRRLVLADADVDAANLPLLLAPEDGEPHSFQGGASAVVDADRCTGCGMCAEACRFDAIRMLAATSLTSHASIDPLACEGCAVCTLVCPEDAITLHDRIDGTWTVGDTRFGPLVHAWLAPTGENSGKLVTQVRKAAEEIAEDQGADLVLVDGPPGIGCPVMASLTGTDLVLAVTEPTPCAEADLTRLLAVARHFHVPVAAVVNKADLNPALAKRLSEDLRAAGLELLGTVPYDESIALEQQRGRSPAECHGAASDALADVYRQLERVLDGLSAPSGVPEKSPAPTHP